MRKNWARCNNVCSFFTFFFVGWKAKELAKMWKLWKNERKFQFQFFLENVHFRCHFRQNCRRMRKKCATLKNSDTIFLKNAQKMCWVQQRQKMPKIWSFCSFFTFFGVANPKNWQKGEHCWKLAQNIHSAFCFGKFQFSVSFWTIFSMNAPKIQKYKYSIQKYKKMEMWKKCEKSAQQMCKNGLHAKASENAQSFELLPSFHIFGGANSPKILGFCSFFTLFFGGLGTQKLGKNVKTRGKEGKIWIAKVLENFNFPCHFGQNFRRTRKKCATMKNTKQIEKVWKNAK